MKDIKPFLPLYMGCEVVYIPNPNLFPSSIYLERIRHSDRSEVGIRDYNSTDVTYVFTADIKLVLRKLDSMTEEEMITYLRLKHNAYTGEYEIEWQANGFWWNFLGIGEEKFKLFGEIIDESNADQFQYLLSKHFDLFNLIDQGLALDSTNQITNGTPE